VEQFEKILATMGAPVARIDMRRLFHFIYTGLKNANEPEKGANKRNLSISNLCKIIDSKVQAVQTPKSAVRDNYRTTDAALKPDDLKKAKATIESSEAPTHGGRDEPTSPYNSMPRQSYRKASRFDQQESNPKLQMTLGCSSLQTNSII